MRWGMLQFGLGAIEDVKAEADIGLVWTSEGQAQALVEQASHQGSVPGLEQRLALLLEQSATWEATRATAEPEAWDYEKDRLLTEFDKLRVDAARTLQDQHKTTQFRGALIGASLVAVGAVGLFWALRRRKKR